MQVNLTTTALKDLNRINEPMKGKIKVALKALSFNPPKGDIKSLKGREGYRLRVGNYRILFRFDNDYIRVTNINTREQIYKGGRKK